MLINKRFPKIKRDKWTTLQVNLGYKCNQACIHCHVNASPSREEMMDLKTISKLTKLMDLYDLLMNLYEFEMKLYVS